MNSVFSEYGESYLPIPTLMTLIRPSQLDAHGSLDCTLRLIEIFRNFLKQHMN
jgi:hypothetical protein